MTSAAICLRQERGVVQVLLIRTKDRERYVFPKGTREQEEEPWQAAVRELLEEAGYGGVAQQQPVFAVLNDLGEGQSYFLVRSAVPVSEPERGRRPRWVPLFDAADLLKLGRKPAESTPLLAALLAALSAYVTQ